ncbi:hypothetical protein AMR42_14365 [Limnothrix sp. PR1529]|uniref:hypothetical protein n=1 Tax=Limnothrix sp. PR1529 TaxID=1704291 RepID=UPI00081E6813|nr:hypothetical protein [Limnothrix sp. PR1529]OCQ94031.1 hypothetical protein BCR12_05820 [Limnothrix sp. P13C2]PIB07306.1 hypothetical protein AMR42_14365 [Limnothrix sp. PR1529]
MKHKEWIRPAVVNSLSRAKAYGADARGIDVVPKSDPHRVDPKTPKIGSRVFRVFSEAERIWLTSQHGAQYFDQWKGVLLSIIDGAGTSKYCVVKCDNGAIREMRSTGMKYEVGCDAE